MAHNEPALAFDNLLGVIGKKELIRNIYFKMTISSQPVEIEREEDR